MIRADLTLADARLGSDFPQFTRTKRKRPANRGPLKPQLSVQPPRSTAIPLTPCDWSGVHVCAWTGQS